MSIDPFDPLRNLLQRAADEPGSPAVVRDLAGRARRKARRRARRRTAVGMAVAAAGCVFLATLILRSRGHTDLARVPNPVTPVHPLTTQPDPGRIRVELASLDFEAAAFRRAIDELKLTRESEERANRAAEILARPGALERIDAARQRTALILVREGERAATDKMRNGEADESFRRAARLFPDTPAGRLAAGRLKTPLIPT